MRQLRRWTLGAIATLSALGMWVAPAALELRSAVAPAQSDWIAGWIDDLKNSSERWILVDLSGQSLTAWEGNYPVYSVTISSGDYLDPTPTGVFEVQSMHTEARMQGDDYDVPDVPYVMYYSGHYAIHGTYWHRNFGTPMSNGCINVAVNHAEWLFYWASIGTPVIVRD